MVDLAVATKAQSAATESPERLLRLAFQRNGYVRVADLARRKERGAMVYKKGNEVRIIVRTEAELARVQDLLRRVGFKPGKPFRKAHQWAQPVYGKAAVEWFQSDSKP